MPGGIPLCPFILARSVVRIFTTAGPTLSTRSEKSGRLADGAATDGAAAAAGWANTRAAGTLKAPAAPTIIMDSRRLTGYAIFIWLLGRFIFNGIGNLPNGS